MTRVFYFSWLIQTESAGAAYINQAKKENHADLRERIRIHLSRCLLLVFGILGGAMLFSACGPGATPATAVPTRAASTVVVLPSATATTPPTAAPSATVTPAPTTPPSTEPTSPPTTVPTALPGDPVNGAKLFDKLPCSSCHDDTHPFPGGIVCPNLGNISTEAALIVKSPDYHGKATDAAGYIRESIINPNAYIVPGANYHTADGQSPMEKDFAQILTPTQIDDLVAYLMTKQ